MTHAGTTGTVKNLYAQESYVNQTRGHMIGETDVCESRFTNLGELYRWARSEYGRCVSRVYIDPQAGGPPKPIGWVFLMRDKYEDSRTGETYLRETWVTVHDGPPVKTIEHKYHALDASP